MQTHTQKNMENNNEVTLHKATINGRKIAYSSKTTWLVQVGKGKSAYKTRYSCTGAMGLHDAWRYYCGINVGYGYKKRLFSPGMNKPSITKAFS